ncbi:MAG: hypothetical protein ACE5OZ_01045 [Candidatus Heimdallarchaeota archaeon]
MNNKLMFSLSLYATTQLYDIPANTYRLNCQIKNDGYQYDLFGGLEKNVLERLLIKHDYAYI